MTSSPIIVTSIPEWKTCCAASGSTQMLNSAAGVMFPSPMAPPISTIRAGRMPRSSASATFVSGPTGTSTVSGRHVLDEEVDSVLGDGLRRALRQLRPVHAALAVDVRGDVGLALERAVRPHRDRHVLPAHEREHAERVVRRLVERLVPVDGRDADEIDLRARERKQERDRIVVPGIAIDDDRCCHPAKTYHARPVPQMTAPRCPPRASAARLPQVIAAPELRERTHGHGERLHRSRGRRRQGSAVRLRAARLEEGRS